MLKGSTQGEEGGRLAEDRTLEDTNVREWAEEEESSKETKSNQGREHSRRE